MFFVFDSVAAEQINVANGEADDGQRQNPRVQREESRERVVAIIGAAKDDLFHPFPNERRAAHDVGGDLGGPVAFLIPRQEVTGE